MTSEPKPAEANEKQVRAFRPVLRNGLAYPHYMASYVYACEWLDERERGERGFTVEPLYTNAWGLTLCNLRHAD